jgi:Tol biopolymer transport system component
MDFGAGHEFSGVSSGRSDVMGTPLYMAPELFTGGLADQRTDIYALGALLYYLVTRTFPVTGRSLADIGEAHARGERARLRDVRPDLPAAFVRAIEQATAADPAQRFATAGDLEAALDAAMRGASVTTTTVPTTARWWLAIAAVAVVAVGATAAWVARTGLLGGSARSAATQNVAAALVTARKILPPPGVSQLSNPSDDGRYVAGMVIETGDQAIVDLTSGTFRALGLTKENPNGYSSLSTISPDGSAIALAWYVGYKGSLHVVRADGSDHRVLVDDAQDVNVYQWSRDGSLILSVISNPDGSNSICLVAAADGAVRRLHTIGSDWPSMMTLSPDGRYVAYDYPQADSTTDRDVFVLDTHTGNQWPVAASPAQDASPLWSPDGDAILFFSDRNRDFDAWRVPMRNGRQVADPEIAKSAIGRAWPRGFTRDGALFAEITNGFAEVYIGSIDGSSSAEAIAPRQALSNFYPKWSRDGRLVAYTSERGANQPRELWVYDTTTRLEQRVPAKQKLGPPLAFSPDDRRLLVIGPNDGRLFTLDRATGETTLVSTLAQQGRWLSEGIVYKRGKSVILQDPDSGRQLRRLDFSAPGITTFDLDLSGRMVTTLWKNGRITAMDVVTGTTREWAEPGVTRLGFQVAAPQSSALAYTAFGKDASGDWAAVKIQTGSAEPRELLRAGARERMVIHGWTADGRNILVARWPDNLPNTPAPTRTVTLWRVPVGGGAPVSTGITMDAVRDVSIHPDGRRIAFNVGFKTSEHWMLENLLAR